VTALTATHLPNNYGGVESFGVPDMSTRLSILGLLCILATGPGCSKPRTPEQMKALNHELFQAVDHHDVASVRRLLDKGAKIEATSYNDMTPLGLAASNNDLPMVQLLLQKGANPHAKDHSLETPLMHAAYDGHAEIVRFLLKQNPDRTEINAALLEVAHGEPAILIMDSPQKDPADQEVARRRAISEVEAPLVETTKLLLDGGADIDVTDKDQGPPLVDAAAHAQTDVVLLLLSRGARLDARDKYGNTALINASCECALATMNSTYDVVKVLLEKGSDVNAHSNDGTTALMNAAGGFGGSAIVKLLLDHGADPRARDANGKTALKYAKEAHREDKVQLLQQALAKPHKR